MLNGHPAFETSRIVLDEVFAEGLWERMPLSDLITEAMRRELQKAPNAKAQTIQKCERRCDYPEVARLCRVIDADTRLVVVDPGLCRLLSHINA